MSESLSDFDYKYNGLSFKYKCCTKTSVLILHT